MTEEVTEAPASAPAPHPGRTTRPRLRLALVGVVVVTAVGFLLIKGLGSSLDYFKTVNEAVDSKAKIGTSTFRLEGTVVKGSVERRVNGASFDIAQGCHLYREAPRPGSGEGRLEELDASAPRHGGGLASAGERFVGLLAHGDRLHPPTAWSASDDRSRWASAYSRDRARCASGNHCHAVSIDHS